MVAYADTSFLVSLYKPEGQSGRAAAALKELSSPLPITDLIFLELGNAINLALFRGDLREEQQAIMWNLFQDDLTANRLKRTPLSYDVVFREASLLSGRWSRHRGTRSLDLLHLASAKVLGAEAFFSLDHRQSGVAKEEGFQVFARESE